jgi:hypothetical protein
MPSCFTSLALVSCSQLFLWHQMALWLTAKQWQQSYTIASGNSAMSVGTITIASGQSVTVSSGSRWVVL